MRTSACTADVACHQLGEGTDGGRAAASTMMVLSKFGKCWQSTCPALSSNVVPTSFMCVNNSIRSCSFCASFAFDEVAGKRVHDGKQNSNRPSAVAQHSNFNANKPASGDCSVAIATVACIYLGMQPTKCVIIRTPFTRMSTLETLETTCGLPGGNAKSKQEML